MITASGSVMRRGRDKKRNLVSTIKKRFSGKDTTWPLKG
jgi:hypothetical protein